MAKKRVLNVGHCSADGPAIARMIHQHFDADVIAADTHDEALTEMRRGPFDLVLVNRVFDADFSSGLELIKKIKKDKELREVPVMLVSNYEHYQQDAVKAGAEPGFGKASLGSPSTVGCLKEHLA